MLNLFQIYALSIHQKNFKPQVNFSHGINVTNVSTQKDDLHKILIFTKYLLGIIVK